MKDWGVGGRVVVMGGVSVGDRDTQLGRRPVEVKSPRNSKGSTRRKTSALKGKKHRLMIMTMMVTREEAGPPPTFSHTATVLLHGVCESGGRDPMLRSLDR